MLKPYLPLSQLWMIGVVLIGALSCTEAPPAVDPDYLAEVEAWRDQRLQRLTAEDGWLSLTGLFWLEPGDNAFGSAAGNRVVLPDAEVAGTAGTLALDEDGTVTARAAEGAEATVNGEPLTEAVLRTDAEGRPDMITVGRNTFYIIDRDGRLAARVRDPQAPSRAGFRGLEHYPIDPAMRVQARFEPFDEPREVAIPTVLGHDTSMTAYGLVHFVVDGRQATLEPYMDGPADDTMLLIFRDATSGDTTYGAGRFLTADAPGPGGRTVLDFNLAYNPPCAFTPYATCPLPPPQNVLEVPIEAGEMYSGAIHH